VESRSNPYVKVACWRHRSGSSGISIEDNGPGLSSEYKSQIFTPFISTKPTEKGTGLGLSYVRSALKEYNASIELQSEKGIGTEFIIRFKV